MIENTDTLVMLKLRLPYLYEKFVKVDEKGIKIKAHVNLENVPTTIHEKTLSEIAGYLLEQSVENLKKTRTPILYFLLYEEEGLCMEIAYTTDRMLSKNVVKTFFKKMQFKKVCMKYGYKPPRIRYGVVGMDFEGRDCICHWIRF